MKPDPNFVVDEKFLKPERKKGTIYSRWLDDMTDCPPKPEKPEILKKQSIFNPWPRPEEKDELFKWRMMNSIGAGTFAGVVNSWFFDFKKIPKIQFRQSLRVHLKYFRKPFLSFTTFGLAFAGTDYLLETYRGGNGKRSLQEHSLIAFTSVFVPMTTAFKNPYGGLKYGIAASLIYTLIKYSNFYVQPGLDRKKEKFEEYKYVVYENPPPMPDYHLRRTIYAPFGIEDMKDKMSPEKLKDKRPDYKEE